MQEQISEFIDFMVSRGIGPSDPSEILADDTIHRYQVDGDKRGVKNGSYQLAVNDDFAFGWALSFKEGETHSWHTKSKRKWSAEEKEAHKKRVSDAKKKRDIERKEVAELSRQEALKIWKSSSKSGQSPYLDRKGVSLRGVRYDGDMLIVPMWRDGEIASVQRILADGQKLFMKGSDHAGAYFSIKGDVGTIAICEGVATSGTVHDATGWSVICAFNAGNLSAVAKTIRDRYPDARLIFAADNDHETAEKHPQIGNVGIDKAQQAAVSIGGAQVIAPPSGEGVSDWNDVSAAQGIDAVRELLIAAPVVDIQLDEDIDNWEPDFDVTDDNPRTAMDPMDKIMPLGHNRGTYYFLPQSTGQIMEMTATSLGRPQNLYQLAPRSFWETLYAPEESMSKIADYASAELINECHLKGIFQPENVRGVGAWKDHGRILVNCGDVIVGEDIKCHPSEYSAKHVYEAGPRVIDLTYAPMTNTEGAEYLDLCRNLSWKRPQYADMMAGWTVISMVSGVLRWRPHITVTGPKGSGKSTVVDYIIKKAVGDIAVCRDGGTTEAGVRKALGCSSRPFIMDEAESESKRDISEMQKIFFLFRRASSGAKVENAYSTFVIRSCACFAAINPRIEHGADKDRNTVLELYADNLPGNDVRWEVLKERIRTTMTDDFAGRLMARTVANLDVLLDNIDTFVAEANKIFGSMRAADQIGPMIAGAYSLISNKRVTPEFASQWMQEQDWNWHTDAQEGTDSEKMVNKIITTRVRYDSDGMGRESQIAEMIAMAYDVQSVGHVAAVKGLGSYGIKIVDGSLLISNNCEPIRNILRDTPWIEYRRALSNHPRSETWGKTVYFGPGIKTKATAIPLSDVIEVANGDDDFVMEGFED